MPLWLTIDNLHDRYLLGLKDERNELWIVTFTMHDMHQDKLVRIYDERKTITRFANKRLPRRLTPLDLPARQTVAAVTEGGVDAPEQEHFVLGVEDKEEGKIRIHGI